MLPFRSLIEFDCNGSSLQFSSCISGIKSEVKQKTHGWKRTLHLCNPDAKKNSRELLLVRAPIQCRRLFKKIFALAGVIVLTMYSCAFQRHSLSNAGSGNETR